MAGAVYMKKNKRRDEGTIGGLQSLRQGGCVVMFLGKGGLVGIPRGEPAVQARQGVIVDNGIFGAVSGRVTPPRA